MSRRVKKSKINIRRLLLFLSAVFVVSLVIAFGLKTIIGTVRDESGNYYVMADHKSVPLYNSEYQEVGTIPRGTEIKREGKEITREGTDEIYVKIIYNKEEYLMKSDFLTTDEEEIVQEEKMYVRTPVTVYETSDGADIVSMIKKGEEVEVLEYQDVESDGTVSQYKIKYGDIVGYVYGKYMEFTSEAALMNYDQDGTYQTHLTRTNTQGGGSAGNLDYFPVEKPKFENNVMPEEVRSLYLNSGVLGSIDSYIEFAKENNINAFVVDIKDNTAPGYASKVMEELSPTSYNRANNSFEKYQMAIKKLKDAGFYVIGRITTFKDSYYVQDHPEDAILDTNTNAPYEHDGSYWPSAFDRDVWEYNVKLAVEAVEEVGFHEIQFDYVRFPDRTLKAEQSGLINYQNNYGEDKAQAIQNFLMYACDEIHDAGAYVSADVFGESAHNYVTGYGQYWGAISNVVDVISGMPYPELFNKYEYGFKEPVWTVPYELLNFWATNYVVKQQALVPTPAIVRNWIQAYDITWRSPNQVYDASMVSEEIAGMYDAGLTGGFITWNASSSLNKYKTLAEAFKKEY